MILDIELLRNFSAIVENKGFTAAADKLHCTQSAVSLKLKRLEAHVDKQLIERNGRIPVPTEDGELMLAYAHKILALNEEVIRKLGSRNLKGKLRLGIVEYLATHRVAKIVSRLKKAFPHLDLRLRVDLSSKLLAELQAGELDIIIGLDYGTREMSELIFSEKLHWVCTKDKPEYQNGAIPMAFLPAPCFYRTVAVRALREIGQEWFEAVTTMSISGIQGAVNAGLAIGVLSRSAVQPEMRILTHDDGFPMLSEMRLAASYRDQMFADYIQPLAEFIRSEIVESAQ